MSISRILSLPCHFLYPRKAWIVLNAAFPYLLCYGSSGADRSLMPSLCSSNEGSGFMSAIFVLVATSLHFNDYNVLNTV